MGVLLSSSIKNGFFFDKMDLMRFYFHVTRCLEKISCGENIVVLLLNIVKNPAI